MKSIKIPPEFFPALKDGSFTKLFLPVPEVDSSMLFVSLHDGGISGRFDERGNLIPHPVSGTWATFSSGRGIVPDFPMVKVPFQPGDYLFVKEEFGEDKNCWLYRADFEGDSYFHDDSHWRPADDMEPKSARFFIKLHDLQIVKLQAANILGFMDAGVEELPLGGMMEVYKMGRNSKCSFKTPEEAFARYWNEVVAAKDDELLYEKNPWVFGYTFSMVPKSEAIDFERKTAIENE